MNSVEEYQNLVELLKTALNFYANPSNYNGAMGTIAPIASDEYGSQARFALEKVSELENLSKTVEDEFVKNIVNSIENGDDIDIVREIILDFKKISEQLYLKNNGN